MIETLSPVCSLLIPINDTLNNNNFIENGKCKPDVDISSCKLNERKFDDDD